jgi:UDP-2,3-diacylglucosamine hydrolase
MNNVTFFISDLHLDSTRPDITAIFLRFLAIQAPQADALYILGDFFEVWIGDDDLAPWIQRILTALRQLSQKIPIYFMPGNRDFLIGKKFLQETGCQLLPDPTVITLYGRRIVLTHGDRLCTQDRLHLLFRGITQQAWLQQGFLCLPLALRQKIAAYLRQKSSQRTQRLDHSTMDVTQQAVMKDLKNYQTHYMIHGHTHRKAVHLIDLPHQRGFRIVLGDWYETGNALCYHQDHQYQLIPITS